MTDPIEASSRCILCDSIKCLALLYLVFKVAIPLCQVLYSFSIGKYLFSNRKQLKKFGTWAVVTGATDGIGKSYARILASEGLNVVLISRNQTKLTELADDLKKQYGVQLKTIAVDFSKTDIYPTIEAGLSNLDIGILVNNVGVSLECPDYLASKAVSADLLTGMVNCNSVSMVMMSRLVLPRMIEHKKGAVINVSSGAGEMVTPLLAVYSGTKAFADFFSRAVSHEVACHGVIVQTVLPLFVATKMSKIRRPSFFAPSADTFAEAALGQLGVNCRTSGCFAHCLQRVLTGALPSSLLEWFVFKQMKAIRQRALKPRSQKSD